MTPPKPHRNRESAKAFRERLKERGECILRLVVPLALKDEARAVVEEWLARQKETPKPETEKMYPIHTHKKDDDTLVYRVGLRFFTEDELEVANAYSKKLHEFHNKPTPEVYRGEFEVNFE